MQIVIEALSLAGLILFSLFCNPGKRSRQNRFFPRLPAALRRPATAYLLAGLLAFGGSALVAGFNGVPQPRIHDEFSCLLAADTFAHGRLTNAPHPLWKHFETIHEIQQPTYASKYPPAQGLALALGQKLFGHPIAGVWLSTGLAVAAICWMLAGWLPFPWAWFGGLLAAIHLVFSGPIFPGNLDTMAYWSQSYWGGSVAALGGALIFGALPRLLKEPRARDAWWLALGLAILANSRPFEGLVASIPVLAVLAVWLVRTGKSGAGLRFMRASLPAALVLLLAGLWMGYYNFRVTGHPFLMPYVVHEATYGVAPVFLCQAPKPEPHYNHQLIREFHAGWSCAGYTWQQCFSGWTRMTWWKIATLWTFFLGVLFTPFLWFLPRIRRRRSVQFALAVCALMLAALLAETWVMPHYAAPVTSLVLLLVVEALRQARLLTWRGWRVGRPLAAAVLPVVLVSSILTFALAQHLQSGGGWHLERAQILHELSQRPQRHLVLVRYGPEHSPHEQWIYNEADIDRAKVVWAWEMGAEADKEVLGYFQDRCVWLLEADQVPPRLTPYPGSSSDRWLKKAAEANPQP